MVTIAQKLLPTLDLASACEVNLNHAAVEWLRYRGNPLGNPLLDPREAQEMIDWLHHTKEVTWSYGSYLEDRCDFLRESYLDDTGGYIHLGVDVNVAPGTVVAAPFDALVENVFDDGDTPQGWGPRLILKPFDSRIPYLILGHLTSLSGYRAGDKVRAGDELAQIVPPLIMDIGFRTFMCNSCHARRLSLIKPICTKALTDMGIDATFLS